jgi:hypothetical protein
MSALQRNLLHACGFGVVTSATAVLVFSFHLTMEMLRNHVPLLGIPLGQIQTVLFAFVWVPPLFLVGAALGPILGAIARLPYFAAVPLALLVGTALPTLGPMGFSLVIGALFRTSVALESTNTPAMLAVGGIVAVTYMATWSKWVEHQRKQS